MVGPLRASIVRTLDPQTSLEAHQRLLGLEVAGHHQLGSWFGQLYGLDIPAADVWQLRAPGDADAELRLFHAPGGKASTLRRVHSWDIGPLAVSWRANRVLEAFDELAASPYQPYSARPSAFNFVDSPAQFHEILVGGPDNAGWALMETLAPEGTNEGPRTKRLFVNTNCFATEEEGLGVYRDLMGLQVRTHYTNHNAGQGNVFNLPAGGSYTFYSLRAPAHFESNSLGINFMVFGSAPDQLDLRAQAGPEFEGRCVDSYEVENLDEFWQRFQASPERERLVCPPLDVPDNPFTTGRAMTFRGPGGGLIEIAEPH